VQTLSHFGTRIDRSAVIRSTILRKTCMRRHRSLTAILVVIATAGLGCSGDEVSAPSKGGALQVVTVTNGQSTDSDGYTVEVDGGQTEPIGPNGQVDFGSLPIGSHTLTLAGVAPNCSVWQGEAQTFALSEDSVTVARFTVICQLSETQVEVTVETSGTDVDGDGYFVSLDQGEEHPISAQGTYAFAAVSPGPHQLTLSGFAPNCRSGESSTPINTATPTLRVQLGVECFSAGIPDWKAIAIPAHVEPWAIWAASSSNVFVTASDSVTRQGLILHYDGTGWTEQYHGGGPAAISGVWGRSGSEVFAVGGDDQFLRYDGVRWTEINVPADYHRWPEVVWGTSATDVFAGGTYDEDPPGYILRHYDGSNWSAMTYPHFGGYGQVEDISGSSPTDVYLVDWGSPYDASPEDDSQRYAIVHYDGESWQTSFESAGGAGSSSQPPPAYPVWAVWDNGPNDVFAVALNGAILHYNGAVWSPMSSPTSAALTDMWGRSASDVYAVGLNTILHYNGTAWSIVSEAPACRATRNCIWGTAAEVFILSKDAVLVRSN
jgi:hypothetical protein